MLEMRQKFILKILFLTSFARANWELTEYFVRNQGAQINNLRDEIDKFNELPHSLKVEIDHLARKGIY